MKLFTLIFLASTSFAAFAPNFQILNDGASVEFEALGNPSALKIKGRGATPKSELSLQGDQISGMVQVETAAFTTGLALRDRHMKEKYLEVAKFSTATLEVGPQPYKVGKNTLKAMLTMHGVTKPVDVIAEIERSGEKYKVGSQFTVDLVEYGISIPSFAGITVAKEVKVSANFTGTVTTLK